MRQVNRPLTGACFKTVGKFPLKRVEVQNKHIDSDYWELMLPVYYSLRHNHHCLCFPKTLFPMVLSFSDIRQLRPALLQHQRLFRLRLRFRLQVGLRRPLVRRRQRPSRRERHHRLRQLGGHPARLDGRSAGRGFESHLDPRNPGPRLSTPEPDRLLDLSRPRTASGARKT